MCAKRVWLVIVITSLVFAGAVGVWAQDQGKAKPGPQGVSREVRILTIKGVIDLKESGGGIPSGDRSPGKSSQS